MGTQCTTLLMHTTSGITSQPLHQSPLATIHNSRVEKDLLLGNWTLWPSAPRGGRKCLHQSSPSGSYWEMEVVPLWWEEHTTVLLESLPLSGLHPCGRRTTEAMSRKRLWQALKVWNKQWVYFVSTTFISFIKCKLLTSPYLTSFPFHCCVNPGLKRWCSR